MCLVMPTKQKKYPDKITVKCKHCDSVYTFKRQSRSALTYWLASDEVRCDCFEPYIDVTIFAGNVRVAHIYPRSIVLKKAADARF